MALAIPVVNFAQSVSYDVEPQIVTAQQKYVDTWRKVGKMKFYVIQVSSHTGDRAVEQAQAQVDNLNNLLSSMPSAKAYYTFQEPNFRVRVGSFMRRNDATRALSLIQEQYPGCFITTEVRRISDVVAE